MRPLILHGHERAITQIKYNRDGDLIFSASKDKQPNVWFAVNGERLGTLDGHEGAVWSIDPNWETTKLVSGAGDNTLRIWDIETGKQISRLDTPTAVRSVNFSYSGNEILYITDAQMRRSPEINVIDVRDPEGSSIMTLKDFGIQKATACLFGPLDESVITGHDNGVIAKWEIKMPKSLLQDVAAHKGAINDLQYNKDQTMFISSSKDCSARIFDTKTLEEKKLFKVDRPVNSAAISPTRDHIVLGGGQEAMEVTTTAVRSGKFEARFFHLVFEQEFARVKGHFGPINSLAFSPDGKGYASGAEDGYVRVHTFDQTYHEFEIEC